MSEEREIYDLGSAEVVPQSSRRLCKNWLDSYMEFTQDFEPPSVFHRWCGILALSVATGHKVWLEEANTKIWPNLYLVLLGPSGCGKGQAMREVLPFIQKTGVPISPDKVTIRKMTSSMAANVILDDVVGAYSPYLIWAEELPSYLGLDGWKSGKIADLTSLYDCAEKWESGTQTQGSDVIPQPYLCMLAGSTPNALFDVLPPASVGQGFTSRLVFVEAKGYERRVAEKPWEEQFHGKLRHALLHDIEYISKLKGAMRMSDIARVYWNDFYLHRPLPQEEYDDDRLQGYAARKPFYAKKIAMLLSLADRPPTEQHPMIVEAHHLERAIYFLEDVDRTVLNVYAEIAKDNVISHYSKVVRWLAKRPNRECTRSEFSQRFAYQMNTKEMTACMGALSDMGIVEVHHQVVTGIAGSGPRYRTSYKIVAGRERAFQSQKSQKEAVDDPEVKGFIV